MFTDSVSSSSSSYAPPPPPPPLGILAVTTCSMEVSTVSRLGFRRVTLGGIEFTTENFSCVSTPTRWTDACFERLFEPSTLQACLICRFLGLGLVKFRWIKGDEEER